MTNDTDSDDSQHAGRLHVRRPNEPIRPESIGPQPWLHDSSTRLLIAVGLLVIFSGMYIFEATSSIKITTCEDLRDFHEAIHEFNAVIFTAVGSVIAFFFVEKNRG